MGWAGRTRTCSLLIQSQLRYHCATAHRYSHYSNRLPVRTATYSHGAAFMCRGMPLAIQELRVERGVVAGQAVLGGLPVDGDVAHDGHVQAAVGVEG
jgi:hypothetical protein